MSKRSRNAKAPRVQAVPLWHLAMLVENRSPTSRKTAKVLTDGWNSFAHFEHLADDFENFILTGAAHFEQYFVL